MAYLSRLSFNRFVGGLLIMAGTGLLVYPSTAFWVANAIQAENAKTFDTSILKNKNNLQNFMNQARGYNASLPGGIIDKHTGSVAREDTPEHAEYMKQLNLPGTDVIGMVKIPKIGQVIPIYHGTKPSTLMQGIGHLYGTALPVGGAGTHSVLTGHSGLADHEFFTHIGNLEQGDTIDIEAAGETMRYEVQSQHVIEPTDDKLLHPVANEDLLTLLTCTPIGINSQRLIVTAHRVDVKSKPATPVAPPIPGFPWWAVWMTLGFGSGLAIALIPGKKNSKDETVETDPGAPAA